MSQHKKEEIVPKVPCPQCEAEQFEDGYGARRRVKGVFDEVGDKCAAPSTRRDVEATIRYVEGLKTEHPDLDWSELLDKAYRSRRRLLAWQDRFDTEPDRVKGFLRLCDQDSTYLSRTAKRFLVDERLRQTKTELERVGVVEISIDTNDEQAVRRLQRRQNRLDILRERILRGIQKVETNLEKLDTRGLLGGVAFWNVLNDTVAQAVQAYLRIKDYADGRDKVDAHKLERAMRMSAQAVVEEEAAPKPKRVRKTAPKQKAEAKPKKKTTRKTVAKGKPAGDSEDPGVAEGKSSKRAARGKTVKLNGTDADPEAVRAALSEGD